MIEVEVSKPLNKGAIFIPQGHSFIELYLIRHAETVMNTNPHLVGGRSNETPLTPKVIFNVAIDNHALGFSWLKRTLLRKTRIHPISLSGVTTLRKTRYLHEAHCLR